MAGSPFHLDLAASAVAAAPSPPLPPLPAAQGAAPPLPLAAAQGAATKFPAAALKLSDKGGGGGPAASGGLLDDGPCGGVLGPAKFALAGADHDGGGGGAALLADSEPASATWPGCPFAANEVAAPSTVGRGGGVAHGQAHGTATTVRKYR